MTMAAMAAAAVVAAIMITTPSGLTARAGMAKPTHRTTIRIPHQRALCITLSSLCEWPQIAGDEPTEDRNHNRLRRCRLVQAIRGSSIDGCVSRDHSPDQSPTWGTNHDANKGGNSAVGRTKETMARTR